MRPTRLFAKNYRTWEALDFDVPFGCSAILGQNGAGKSSIINILDLALFGGRDLKRQLGRGFAGDLELGVEFEADGDTYRVVRGYSPKGGGKGWVRFERYAAESVDPGATDPADTDQWAPLTRETAKATDEAIIERIKVTRETFRASAFLRQADSAAFTEADPRVRKQILADMLGLELWDRLADRARRDAKEAEGLAGQIAVTLDVIGRQRTQAADAVARHADSEGDVERLAAEIEQIGDPQPVIDQAQALWAKTKEDRADYEGRHREWMATTEREARVKERLEQLGAATAENVDEVRRAAAEVPALERRAERIREQTALRDAQVARVELLVAQVKAEQQALEALAQSDSEARRHVEAIRADLCPTCEQPLGSSQHERLEAEANAKIAQLEADARAKADEIIRLGAERDEAAVEVARLNAEITESGEDMRRLGIAKAAAEWLTANNEREATREILTEQQAAIAKDVEVATSQKDRALERLQQYEAELEAMREPVNEARAKLERRRGLEQLRQAAEVQAAGARAAKERVRQLDAEAEAEQKRLDGVMADRRVFDVLVKAYGRDGVPAMIVENAAVPMIETEANRILSEFATGYRVELRTQRATAKGDIREALDIVVQTDSGEALYEDFSGGERTRLNLALRIGLARLLAHRRGADVQILVIDEPEFLDDEGVGRLAAILLGLRDDFDHVLLISHVPALADSFDQAITVTKTDDGRSVIGRAA